MKSGKTAVATSEFFFLIKFMFMQGTIRVVYLFTQRKCIPNLFNLHPKYQYTNTDTVSLQSNPHSTSFLSLDDTRPESLWEGERERERGVR